MKLLIFVLLLGSSAFSQAETLDLQVAGDAYYHCPVIDDFTKCSSVPVVFEIVRLDFVDDQALWIKETTIEAMDYRYQIEAQRIRTGVYMVTFETSVTNRNKDTQKVQAYIYIDSPDRFNSVGAYTSFVKMPPNKFAASILALSRP